MKILITVGIFPPEIGGPATYTHSFANWLNSRSQDVTVLTTLLPGILEEYSFPVDVVPKKGRLLWHLNVFFRMLKLMKHVDVVYINGLLTESFLAAILRRKPMICRVSGDLIWEKAVRNRWTTSEFEDFQVEKGNTWVWMLRKFRTYYLNRTHKIIVPSTFLGRIVGGWQVKPGKIIEIFNPYTPVKAGTFTLPPSTQGKFIISTGGRLVSWKGIETVLQAVANLPGTFLVIAGSGPDRENLEEKTAKLRISDRVHFTGQVSRGQLAGLFSQSDCFVINSRYEGLPHIVLEAMASGCPVVAGGVGGTPEVVVHGKTGFLFPQGDVEAMIQAISELRDNSSLRREMGENSKVRVKKMFDLDQSYGQVEDILKECSHGRG